MTTELERAREALATLEELDALSGHINLGQRRHDRYEQLIGELRALITNRLNQLETTEYSRMIKAQL